MSNENALKFFKGKIKALKLRKIAIHQETVSINEEINTFEQLCTPMAGSSSTVIVGQETLVAKYSVEPTTTSSVSIMTSVSIPHLVVRISAITTGVETIATITTLTGITTSIVTLSVPIVTPTNSHHST